MKSVKTNVLQLFAILLLSAFFSESQAQGVLTKRPNIFIDPNCNGFIEYLPEGYASSGQNYPLLVFFGGMGQTGDGSLTDLEKFFGGGNNFPHDEMRNGTFPASFTVNGQTMRFIMISPQFVTPFWSRRPTPDEVNDVINYCVQHYRVDASRIYLTGVSSGGEPVWEYPGASSTYANRIAAIIPFCGTSTPTDTKARNIANANIAVWAFHNEFDAGVPVWITLNYVGMINQPPAPNPPAKATVFPQSGHDCWTEAFARRYTENNLNIFQWMLQFSKNASPPNQSPTANAGPDQNITLPVSSVQLNGSGNDPDGSISNFNWSKMSGPAGGSFNNASIANPVVSGLTQGTYTFRLTVTDNKGATATDDVTVTVNAAANQSPTANAGVNQAITLPNNSVTLNGSGSDPDGFIASYSWNKQSGPAQGTINGPSSASTTVSGLVQGSYVFRLTVTDNGGASAISEVMITVNAAANQTPTANAGVDQTITLPTSSVQLNGSGNDPDGSISNYSWSKVSGPSGGNFNNASISNPVVSILTQGTYIFRLTVTDNMGASATDDVAVTVNSAANQSPTANAGANQTITLPTNSVNLNGSGNDPDGFIASYSWSKQSGPAQGTINGPSSASTTVSGLVQGSYVFRLIVTDNGGASAISDVTITVNPQSTISTKIQAENWSTMSGVQTENVFDVGGGLNVGWIDLGDWMDYLVTTGGAGTYTVNLRIATPNNGVQLQIKKQDGTVLSTVNLPNTGAYQNWQTVSTTIALAAGTQTIRLQSSANAGWNINWLEIVSGGTPSNQPPTANAGINQTITLPTNSVTLNGSGNDPDGFIASYSWTKQSGPAQGIINGPSSASTTVSGLVQGSYVFRLTVTDNGGASAISDVTITVNPQSTISTKIQAENWSTMSGVQTENVFDVGGGLNVGWIDLGDWMDYLVTTGGAGTYTVNLRIATPNNGAQLQIKKQDGTVLSTVNLPNTGAYQNWQTISTTIALAAGTQTIRLQSSANPGWNINWLEIVSGGTPSNQPPTANAGINQTITLPTNSVTLNGSGNDPDGFIASYSWTKQSGPAQGTINGPSSASTTVSGLVQGSYVFRLTVTDNGGASAISDVTITVNPQSTISTKIQAENWSNMSGVQTENVFDAGGGLNVGWIDLGDWMDYLVTTGGAGTYTVNLRIATPNNGAQLQIKKQDGTVLSTVNLPNTGAYQNWQTVSTTIALAAGTQTIRLQSSANPGWNINWLEIVQGSGTARRNPSSELGEASLVFEVFPNPVLENCTISLNNPYSGNLKVQLINMKGAVQKEFNLNKPKGINKTNISLKELPAGSYIIKLIMKEWKDTKFLIKL